MEFRAMELGRTGLAHNVNYTVDRPSAHFASCELIVFASRIHMTTNPSEPTIRIAAIYVDVPTVWVDQFETTDRRGERVVVMEWTGAIDHDGNVTDGNRYATGVKVGEDGRYGDHIFRDLDVPQPANVKAAMDALRRK